MNLNQIAENAIFYLDIKCRFCDTPITADTVRSKDHPGGREIDGYDEPQWVFFRCSGCGYDWNLSELKAKARREAGYEIPLDHLEKLNRLVESLSEKLDAHRRRIYWLTLGNIIFLMIISLYTYFRVVKGG